MYPRELTSALPSTIRKIQCDNGWNSRSRFVSRSKRPACGIATSHRDSLNKMSQVERSQDRPALRHRHTSAVFRRRSVERRTVSAGGQLFKKLEPQACWK